MKNITKRITVSLFCMVLCGFTAYATPMIDAPFNPFDRVDELPATTTAAVIPTTAETVTAATEPEPTTKIEPTTAAPVPALIPARVEEKKENGLKKIVKTYELSAKENPEHISRDSFELNGWEYIFTDMTKKETIDTKTREYTQTVKIIPDTDDVTAIIGVLDKTKSYTSSDGYSGTLKLVENSVKAEISGTKTVPFTLTETRTYENLSSNDSSYIAKSISDKYGRVLTLSDLQWRSYSNVYIDSNTFADSYTATATYTGTGYRNVITGYTGSAEYTGIIKKTIPGKTIYTAVFTGTEIPPPTTAEPITEPPTTTEEPTTEPEIIEEPKPEPFNPIAVVAGSTGGAGLFGGLIFFFLKMKNVKVCNFQNGQYVQIGKTRIGYKIPAIDLTPFAQKSDSTAYALIIGRFAAWRLSGKTIKINYGDKSFEHTVNSNGFKEYQFEVKF